MSGNFKKIKRATVMISPFGATKEQYLWLKNKAATTGDSQASVMRKLIQNEIDKEITLEHITISHPALSEDIVVVREINHD